MNVKCDKVSNIYDKMSYVTLGVRCDKVVKYDKVVRCDKSVKCDKCDLLPIAFR